ncbi:MAG: SCO family protein [Planctomycetes bacterium]|nr:SCO family protein [Planctomycetota bacterium]
MMRHTVIQCLLVLPLLFSASSASSGVGVRVRVFSTSSVPLCVLRTQDPAIGVAFDQRLGEQVPLDAVLRDESGAPVPLGTCLNGKPAILALVYYKCPMLCTLVINGTLRALRTLPLNAGQDFQVLAVSFDPRETPDLARAKKAEVVRAYEREGGDKGWRFFTADEPAIREITESVGFRYRYDARTDQWAHASGIVVLTPEGRIARYFYGVEYSARDLRLGLVEAADGKIGSAVDQLLLLCLQYDPSRGRYSMTILTVLRAAGVLTVCVLGAYIFIMIRRERRKRA